MEYSDIHTRADQIVWVVKKFMMWVCEFVDEEARESLEVCIKAPKNLIMAKIAVYWDKYKSTGKAILDLTDEERKVILGDLISQELGEDSAKVFYRAKQRMGDNPKFLNYAQCFIALMED